MLPDHIVTFRKIGRLMSLETKAKKADIMTFEQEFDTMVT